MTLGEQVELAAGIGAYRIMRSRDMFGRYYVSISIHNELLGVVHAGSKEDAEQQGVELLARWLDVQNRRAQIRVVKEDE